MRERTCGGASLSSCLSVEKFKVCGVIYTDGNVINLRGMCFYSKCVYTPQYHVDDIAMRMLYYAVMT